MASSTTSLKLDPDIKSRVRKLAVARRRSAHWVMREAIERYVTQEEQREQFWSEAMAAWEEYQATGEYVSAKDMDTWLARLEAGDDAALPRLSKHKRRR
jgi:predicted transcriptional regulator